MMRELPEPGVMCDCGGDYYTADQVRQAVAAAMERAAQIADSYGEDEWMGQDCANRIAAAIRKETL